MPRRLPHRPTGGGGSGRPRPIGNRPSSEAKTKQEQRREAEERVKTERLMFLEDELKALWAEFEDDPTKQFAGGAEEPNSIPEWRGFCFGAHTWGLAMIRATRRHVRNSMSEEGAWEAYKETFERVERFRAYAVGYKAWFESARAEPGSSLSQLFRYTQNEHTGRNAKSDPFRLVVGEVLNKQANDAFTNWRQGIQRQRAAALLVAPPAPAPASAPTPVPLVPAPPAVVAAADVAKEQAEELLPTEPLPVARRYDAMLAFLESPKEWHTFDAGPPLVEEIEKALAEDRMFAVAPAPGDKMPTFRLLDSKCIVTEHENGEEEFGDFLRDHNFRILLQTDENRRHPSNEAQWPDKFASLQLAYVGHGSFNSIWTNKPGVNYDNSAFPYEVVEYLNAGKTVLRAPLPRHPARGWVSRQTAVAEMTNMATAALHGYGPYVYAMGWERSEDGTHYRLYSFLQRGAMDVEKRVSRIQAAPPWAMDTLDLYFDRFLRAVWGYSSDRFVFIDAKLKNFIDSFSGPEVELVEGARGTVRVIDLAGDGFRQMWTVPTSQADARINAQGWRPIWLHNVLVVSCAFRLNLPYDYFCKLWWNKVHAAVLRVRTELGRRRAFPDDGEYSNAADFVRACKWTGPLYTGRWSPTDGKYVEQTFPEPQVGNAPAAVAEECRRFATFYFHDVWHRYGFVNYATAVLNHLQAATADDKSATALKREKAAKEYDVYYVQKLVPMQRHFREHLGRNHESAPTLVHVMFQYCAMPEDELKKRYLLAQPPAATMRFWPRMTSSSQHNGITLPQARNERYWNGLLGFA